MHNHHSYDMSTSAFPQELVEHVIDFLGDDRRALSACALVSRDWLPRAHYHRFAAVSLPIPYHGVYTRCAKFDEILDRNPELSAYIQSLTLDGIGFLGHAVRWTDKEAIKCVRLQHIRALTLSRFEFRSLADLVPTLCAFPRLEELTLNSVLVRQQLALRPFSPTPPPLMNQPRASRPLKAVRFTGEPIGELVPEHDSAAFALALMDAGALSPNALTSLALLSSAGACAGWIPFFPSIATSLQDCAVSLHELVFSGELTENSRTSARFR